MHPLENQAGCGHPSVVCDKSEISVCRRCWRAKGWQHEAT